VLIVTEPSPAALHDMARLLEVIGFSRRRRSGPQQDRRQPRIEKIIQDFADDHGLPILGEIPYDIAMPLAISMAQPVVTAFPDSPPALAIRAIADRLAEAIGP